MPIIYFSSRHLNTDLATYNVTREREKKQMTNDSTQPYTA